MKNNTKNKKHEILPGLTTTPNSDWRGKVEEIKKYKIKKIALFPTFLGVQERKELYSLLDEIKGLEIPHVHLRGQDEHEWEMEWYQRRGAKVFNIHMGKHENIADALKPYKKEIFIENHIHRSIPEKELKHAAGICLDFQHWEWAKKIKPGVAKATEEYAEEFKIGCCHVSPFPKMKNALLRFFKRVQGHYLISMDEVDYLLQYKKYLPQYISLEMENTFERQLEVKKYLEKKLEL